MGGFGFNFLGFFFFNLLLRVLNAWFGGGNYFPAFSSSQCYLRLHRRPQGRATPGRRRFPTAPHGGEREAPAGHAVHRRVADSLGRHLTNRDIGDRLQSRPVPARPLTAPFVPGGAAPRRRNGRGRRSQPSRRWGGARPAEG